MSIDTNEFEANETIGNAVTNVKQAQVDRYERVLGTFLPHALKHIFQNINNIYLRIS